MSKALFAHQIVDISFASGDDPGCMQRKKSYAFSRCSFYVTPLNGQEPNYKDSKCVNPSLGFVKVLSWPKLDDFNW